MPFLTEVHFQNYRSFLDAKCRLSPVTLVIGANNAGKSNFLRGLADLNDTRDSPCHTNTESSGDFEVLAHRQRSQTEGNTSVVATDSVGSKLDFTQDLLLKPVAHAAMGWGMSHEKSVRLYTLDEKAIGISGDEQGKPEVLPNGEGTVRVLHMLSKKKPETFRAVEAEFSKFIPEVEKLIVGRDTFGQLHITVKETGIETPEKLHNISPGSRTILALLTIIHQPKRPELVLLEDIEHAIHPRGIGEIIDTMRRISDEHGVQFIFTSHHPYVLDCFRAKEHWRDVVIVEKKDGVSRLANMDTRLKRLHYEEEMDKVRLHELWYSGLMGGVANPPPAWDKEP